MIHIRKKAPDLTIGGLEFPESEITYFVPPVLTVVVVAGVVSSTLAVFAEALEAQHDPPVAPTLEAEQPDALALTNFTSPDASALAAATSASGRVKPEATFASIHESRVNSDPVMTLACVALADWHLA